MCSPEGDLLKKPEQELKSPDYLFLCLISLSTSNKMRNILYSVLGTTWSIAEAFFALYTYLE